jgi:predicted nucleotidyltransferase
MEIKNLKDLEKFFQKKNLLALLGVNKIGVFGSFARNENLKILIC